MSMGVSECQKNSAELRAMTRARKERKFMMRARLALRDLEYAAAHVPVTVEERGGRVIETRGRCCIAPRVTHLGSC